MEITEKVAYLKGLAEGMELDTEKKEGKLLSAIIDVLEDIALELEDIHDETSELADGLDAVSDDLEDVEDVVLATRMKTRTTRTASTTKTTWTRMRTATPPLAPPARRPSILMSPCWKTAR